MQELFDAVDITLLATNVSSIMIGFIGVGLLFVGFRYVQKVTGFRR